MSRSKTSQVMELKEEDHKIIFRPELPLINPETIFSVGVWTNILGLVEQYLRSINFEVHSTFFMDFKIKDLYFAKAYNHFDFERAKKILSKITSVEHNDEDDDFSLLMEEWGVRLYFYRDAVRFAAGSHREIDGVLIKKGRFTHQRTRWNTTREEFLEFIDVMEKLLMNQGVPLECRVFMEVQIPHARIDIGYFYQMPTIIDFPVKADLPEEIKQFEKQRLKIIPSKATITIFI